MTTWARRGARRASREPLYWTGLGRDDAPAACGGLETLTREHKEAARRTSESARYQFRARAGGVGEILLRGPIGRDFFGDGITSKAFTEELRGLGDVKTIELVIDSPGGSVSDARAIYTQLITHGARVNVTIDGNALSAASYIAMAGDKISIGEGSFVMIHNARAVLVGSYERADLDEIGTRLDAVSAAILDTYHARTRLPKATLSQWMDDETWFNGAEAVDEGFATDLIPNKTEAKALAYASAFANVPTELRARKSAARAALSRIDELVAAHRGI